MSENRNSPIVNGIIAEYNPFHNGHKYQLESAKKQTGADYTIIVMSGNFMQRGTPALLDKYTRTKMALKSGADLVLEIPTIYAASSAEYFATGAVSLLDKLGVVNYLNFGSECGDISVLQKIADILEAEPLEYTDYLRQNTRQGLSYPSARTTALLQYCPELSVHRDVLSSPNNILGIEYIKALNRRHSSITPLTTLRASSDYHNRMLGTYYSSSLALRQAIYDHQDTGIFADQMPEEAYQIFMESLERTRPIQLNDLSSALHYKLLMEADEGYEHYLDVSQELSDRIKNNLYHFTNFRYFCDLIKTKDVTYTRVSRSLLHILLGIEKVTMEQCKRLDYVPYARVLGFRKEAKPLLTAIKKSSDIPLLTKLADADTLLTKGGLSMLKQEIRMNSIYKSAEALKSRQPMENEYCTPIVIV